MGHVPRIGNPALRAAHVRQHDGNSYLEKQAARDEAALLADAARGAETQVEVEEAVTDAPTAEQGPARARVAELNQRLEDLKAAHQNSLAVAEESFKAALADAVQQLRAAEREAETEVDEQTRARLAAAVSEAVEASESDETEATRVAQAERDLKPYQDRAASAGEGARKVVRAIEKLMAAHRADFDKLGAITETEWRRGLPTEGPDAVAAFNIARGIPAKIEDLLSYVGVVKKQTESAQREIDHELRTAPAPFGHRDTNEYYVWRREYNSALRDLERVNDGSVAYVQSGIHSILQLVARINELRAKYRGRRETAAPPLATENGARVIEKLDELRQRTERPTQAESWSVFE